jgi:hypothetical protein
MKNPFYVVETFHSTGAMDYPEWHKEGTYTTLQAALNKKAKMLALKEEDYDGRIVRAWRAKEVRIVEHTRKVVR